jgi:hypothetical protein
MFLGFKADPIGHFLTMNQKYTCGNYTACCNHQTKRFSIFLSP